MEIITLKINGRSSYGKAILELINIGVREKKGIEIIKEESPYNAEFVKRIKKSSASKNRTRVTAKNLWESI